MVDEWKSQSIRRLPIGSALLHTVYRAGFFGDDLVLLRIIVEDANLPRIIEVSLSTTQGV